MSATNARRHNPTNTARPNDLASIKDTVRIVNHYIGEHDKHVAQNIYAAIQQYDADRRAAVWFRRLHRWARGLFA